MSTILGSKQFYAGHSILHQIENHIHGGNSISIRRCILHKMGSSKLSHDTYRSIKKLNQKEKSFFQKTKSFILNFFVVLPFRLSPITTDMVTDSLLVKDLDKKLSGGTMTTIITTCTQINSKGLIFEHFFHLW